MATSNIYGGKFCSPEERQVTTIGTGYIANFISGGGAARVGATLTNRRVYFSGTVYERDSRGRLASFKKQNIINVRDITGTGYLAYKPTSYLIAGVIALILGILFFATEFLGEISSIIGGGGIIGGIAFFISYYIGCKTLFTIEYAGGIGGMIAFDVRWIQSHEQDSFIRCIQLAKDKLYSVAATEQGFVGGNNDSIDEIPDL